MCTLYGSQCLAKILPFPKLACYQYSKAMEFNLKYENEPRRVCDTNGNQVLHL